MNPPNRRARRLAVAVAVITASIAAALAVGGAVAVAHGGHDDSVLGPGPVTVDVTIHHSRYEPSQIRVRPGTAITFVVHNTDPIGHELIVGDAELHRRHENGTEPYHPPRPGEVSIAGGATATTTYTVPADGTPEVLYACHLPGHFRYGMSGWLEVAS